MELKTDCFATVVNVLISQPGTLGSCINREIICRLLCLHFEIYSVCFFRWNHKKSSHGNCSYLLYTCLSIRFVYTVNKYHSCDCICLLYAQESVLILLPLTLINFRNLCKSVQTLHQSPCVSKMIYPIHVLISLKKLCINLKQILLPLFLQINGSLFVG